MSSAIQFQLGKQAMLSGKKLILRPLWALSMGGVPEALLYEQLLFRSGAYQTTAVEPHVVRFSYSRLREQLPFYSRRWLVEVVKKLEAIGAISVTRGSRVNEYQINLKYLKDLAHDSSSATEGKFASLLVFPDLAVKVGVMEAVALQQIHIRHHEYDGSVWVIRSMEQWRNSVFMFLGEATVKRLFGRLRQLDLIYVGSYTVETGVVNKYRVNYIKVAQLLGVPLPMVDQPKKGHHSDGWLNPLYPVINVSK